MDQNNNNNNTKPLQNSMRGQNQLFYELTENKYSIPQKQINQQKEKQQNGQKQAQERKNTPVSSPPSSSRSHSVSQSNQEKWEYQSIKQGQQKVNTQKQANQSQIKQKSRDKQKQAADKIIRYKYCCKKCKHADRQKDKKACVCVVPRDQRRTHLGNQGCQTCGCAGCSKQDFIFRGQDPQYHPEEKKKQNKKVQNTQNFEARNGCCKNCMKAFSKSNKSCICQVPESVRKTKLSSTGCKICGCIGCNPQDRKGSHRPNKSTNKRSRSRSQRRKDKKQKRSRSKDKKKRSKSRSPQYIDTYAMNFHNIDRSIIGSMIINEYQIDPALLGFGIPQRSNSYLLGKNRQK